MNSKESNLAEKVEVYESFFHQINLCTVSMNTARIRDAVSLISAWSYAHRQGNGELSEEEQDALIRNKFEQMRNFK